jgi:hypothetical protein
VTDVNGIYVVRGLPPGDYTVTIEMDGMATVKRPASRSDGPSRSMRP